MRSGRQVKTAGWVRTSERTAAVVGMCERARSASTRLRGLVRVALVGSNDGFVATRSGQRLSPKGRERMFGQRRSSQECGAECRAHDLRPLHHLQLTFAYLTVVRPSDRLMAVGASWASASDRQQPLPSGHSMPASLSNQPLGWLRSGGGAVGCAQSLVGPTRC